MSVANDTNIKYKNVDVKTGILSCSVVYWIYGDWVVFNTLPTNIPQYHNTISHKK
jgi:hypothetical protein